MTIFLFFPKTTHCTFKGLLSLLYMTDEIHFGKMQMSLRSNVAEICCRAAVNDTYLMSSWGISGLEPIV